MIETQSKLILEHMERYDDITPLEALEMYGCLRLSARIWELRKKGYIIETDAVRRNGKCYAKYILKGHKNDLQT